MRKKIHPSKLTLNKETLHHLGQSDIERIAGGATQAVRHCTVPFTAWPTCDPIT
ncbi:MAG: class I lanthipeptide [Acidobacteriota bacterium]|nr:class I lanthipeptide [Acidobacteriota bacterium]